MQLTFLQYLVLFFSSLICVGVLTPLMRRIAIRREIVDRPNEGHKTHVEPTPYLGGVAIVLGVTLISYLALFIGTVKSSSCKFDIDSCSFGRCNRFN
jgi:UDP-GlcNAc:undecaprenyl-phosphate GlcNAc-1-phosphate transferase